MSGMSELEQVLADAPPGMIVHGTIAMHKAPGGQIIMVSEIGDTTSRMVVSPVFIRAMAGKGPMGKVLSRFFNPAALGIGGGDGPVDG